MFMIFIERNILIYYVSRLLILLPKNKGLIYHLMLCVALMIKISSTDGSGRALPGHRYSKERRRRAETGVLFVCVRGDSNWFIAS